MLERTPWHVAFDLLMLQASAKDGNKETKKQQTGKRGTGLKLPDL